MSQWRIRLRSLVKRVFTVAIRVLPLNFVRALFEASMESLHRRGPDFVTHRTLPKSGAAGPYHVLDPILPIPGGPIGIVIQGPLYLPDDFTVETVRYYSRVRPQVVVIVSTWEGEDAAALDRIRELGAEVVLSEKPALAGRINVNFQTRSAAAGINRAIELGCRFVAKTRSDQRILCLPLLLSLPRYLDYFPLGTVVNQRRRLVGTSWGTTPFCPYYFGDQFMFGICTDMLDFWSPPLDEMDVSRDKLMETRDSEPTLAGFTAYSPEHYLITQFLKRDGGELPFRLKEWWKVLADRFCVINWSDLDIYWPKYDPKIERRDYANDDLMAGHPLRWWDWLALHSGLGEDPPGLFEGMLNQPPWAPLPARLPRLPQVR